MLTMDTTKASRAIHHRSRSTCDNVIVATIVSDAHVARGGRPAGCDRFSWHPYMFLCLAGLRVGHRGTESTEKREDRPLPAVFRLCVLCASVAFRSFCLPYELRIPASLLRGGPLRRAGPASCPPRVSGLTRPPLIARVFCLRMR